jgi:DNA-binding NarL/FixJ family response regulator
MIKGATNVEIAQRTGLPVTTIGGRRTRIMQILNATSGFDLAEKVQQLELLS